jgi:carbonic anhydrase
MELKPIDEPADIPPHLRGTPVGDFLEYHDLGRPHEEYTTARLLIGACMDHRTQLRIPDNFAYILRAGGANLRPSEFKVSYAIAVGGVRAIALMGHTQCGMVNLVSRRQQFVEGLVDAGWERERAEQHFDVLAPHFEIGEAAEFVKLEAVRLRWRYPKVLVCPLIYRVEDNRIYVVPE